MGNILMSFSKTVFATWLPKCLPSILCNSLVVRIVTPKMSTKTIDTNILVTNPLFVVHQKTSAKMQLQQRKKKLSMEYLEGSLTKEDISVVEDRIQNNDCPRSFNGKSKSISELMYWKARDFICQTPVTRKKILLRTTSVARHLYICQVRWICSEKKLIFVRRKFFEGQCCF